MKEIITIKIEQDKKSPHIWTTSYKIGNYTYSYNGCEKVAKILNEELDRIKTAIYNNFEFKERN